LTIRAAFISIHRFGLQLLQIADEQADIIEDNKKPTV